MLITKNLNRFEKSQDQGLTIEIIITNENQEPNLVHFKSRPNKKNLDGVTNQKMLMRV